MSRMRLTLLLGGVLVFLIAPSSYAQQASLTTLAATSITPNSAVLNATGNVNGGIGTVYFQWSTSPTLATSIQVSQGTFSGDITTHSFVYTANNLQHGTTYYFRIAFYDSANNQWDYGNILNFTTLTATLTTEAATSITPNSAVLNATGNVNGGIGTVYFQWSTSPTLATSIQVSQGTFSGDITTHSFVYTANNLQHGTTYYFRIAFYDSANNQWDYGNILSFTTTVSTTNSDTLGSCTTANPCTTSAEPVDTENGNYFYHHADLGAPGRGLPFLFQRAYNSLDYYSGSLGANWTDSYNIFLTFTSSGIVVKWGDGHTDTYSLMGSLYVPPRGVHDTLNQNPSDGTWVITKKNQTQFRFANSGSLSSIVDKNGNMIRLTYDANGNLSTITDAAGRIFTFSYDASNRIVSITDPIGRKVLYSYSPSGDLATVTDPMGGVTTYTYNESHCITSITLPNGATLLKNTYDSSGRVTAQTNGRGFAWAWAYDTPSPDQTTITDPLGNKTVHTYDSLNRITHITDSLGGQINYAYDADNNRIGITNQDGQTTKFSYDAQGNIASITDALGDTTAFTYDAKNDLLTTTNPKDKTTKFSYDANGNLLSIEDALGGTTTFTYDGTGELKAKTDADGHTTTYGYDSSGDLTSVTDAPGAITRLGYDGIGRLTSIKDPNGHTAHAAYDALSRLTNVTDPLDDATKFQYDAIGNLTKITDADGNATSYAYDAGNNLVSVTDAMGQVTRYSYDGDNNRVSFQNALGNTTSYGYDTLNRPVTVTDPLSFVTSYSYDPAGKVVEVKDANGKTSQFTYDALNRPIGISYADGKNVTYAYDADGNRTRMVDAHGATTYAYDWLDRLTSVTNQRGAKVGYSYDAVGNRASLTYPNGNVVHYAYDGTNRLSKLTDWFGRVTNYTYDQASNLLSQNYPNGATVSFAYDNANRLTEVLNTYRGSTGNPVSAFTYVLDPVGNCLQVTDGSGVATQYGYDRLYELTSVTRDTKVTSYTYDPAGNRLTLTAPGTSINYSYDADDRLLSAGGTTFVYDANGNRIKETTSSGIVTYAFDSANRLISVTGGGEDSTFAYDGDGNRISQTVGSGTYSYINDVATALPVVLQESGPDGDINYDYGLGRVSETSSAFDYFCQYDGLGTVVGLTDHNGKLAGRYIYDAWGSSILSVPDNHIGTKNKFRFTGEALDPGTGLYFLRARYYDPSVGRFLSTDVFPGSVTSPLSANRFSYALNNPIRNVDPTGFSSRQTAIAAQNANFPFSSYLMTFGGTVVEFGVNVFGVVKYGVQGAGEIVSGGLGLLKLWGTAPELRDPWVRLTDFYNNTLTPDQRNQLDGQITVVSGETWDQLSPDQKKQQWGDSLFRVWVIDSFPGFADYELYLKHLPL